MLLNRDTSILILSLSFYLLIIFFFLGPVIILPQNYNPLTVPIKNTKYTSLVLGISDSRNREYSGVQERENNKIQKTNNIDIFNNVDPINYDMRQEVWKNTDQENIVILSTNDKSSVNTLNWYKISAIKASETTDNNFRFLLSFDNRLSWRTWDDQSWKTVITSKHPLQDIGQLFNKGLTSKELSGLSTDAYNAVGGYSPGTTTNIDIMEMIFLPKYQSGNIIPSQVRVYGN